MSRNNRDDFTEETKRVVAERAAYFCTKPDCREPTVGPHSDPNKSLKTGKAGHIRAAAPGGPRYDPAQTPEERRSIENAIWLCSRCSDPVDKDAARFPVELLLDWKASHEEWIRDGGVVPKLPQITIETLAGFTLPEAPGEITGSQLEGMKEHRLTFENVSATEIRDIRARIQFPEPVTDRVFSESPAGVTIIFEPDRMPIQFVATGNAKISRARPPLPTGIYRFRVDRLGRQKLAIGFITSMQQLKEHAMPDELMPSFMERDSNTLNTYIDGSFSYEYHGALLIRRFFAPVALNRQTRAMSIVEVRPDSGPWSPAKVMVFS